MVKLQQPWVFFSIFMLLQTTLFHLSYADVGTASHYSNPGVATACFGNDVSQFPTSNLFAAAGDGIWDNGASCGRQYLVRCISAATPGTCNPSETIQIRIVDRADTSVSRPSTNGATIVLSTTAFGAIANPSAASVNIEFQQ
ncbi:putative EG45-like domain containing protein 1 [Durio zibethinus]|uniref:EG45-like domain containing protein 1 n=1 Tax=Durio zibethinus TaxID=66656 RepID=A0A6P5ZGV4_DURZI|nr:putative EG45-like domain containing protein 1 [Durio zibethinus]